eukprot:TRINITY_DN32391_c0_g1_i1.p1 TRINITY_DN32391_c0_g1~~TRINITY_DN32391_c0_g1_i1.p1  ORF type:complete len:377 (+),score=52.53 TRINITY_DN32391_c0_g1_i1:55-1131(+)
MANGLHAQALSGDVCASESARGTQGIVSLPALSSQAEELHKELASNQPFEEDYMFQDEFENMGVANELLEMNACREDEVHGVQSKSLQGRLQPRLRAIALSFLWKLLYSAGFVKQWAEAVTLLDAYCTKSEGKAADSLPATCLAIFRILVLFEHDRPRDLGLLLEQLSSESELSGFGFPCDSSWPTDEEVKRRQISLLQTMEGNVKLPSLLWWVTAYSLRLDICTGKVLATSIDWAFTQSMNQAQAVLTHHASSHWKSPRRISAGLFAMNLVQAGLLAVNDLRPLHVSATQWARLLKGTGLEHGDPPFALPKEYSERVFESLELATTLSAGDIQDGCQSSLEIMQMMGATTSAGTIMV